MNASNNILCNLQPTFISSGPLLLIGLRELMDEQAAQKIPLLWQELQNHRSLFPRPPSSINYGLCIHLSGYEYSYMAAWAVEDFDELPEGLSPHIIPSQHYAVFNHPGHVSAIRSTMDFIFNQWLPQSDFVHAATQANAVHFFERYGEGFNPQTGEGDIEIWLPVNAKSHSGIHA
jgi:AraC family transcriptional regulator